MIFAVAPLAGAWIEIREKTLEEIKAEKSLLSQERGLKFPALGYMAQDPVVAPLAGAWIE